jgi:tetratricopeptide (TPR) repeat protein
MLFVCLLWASAVFGQAEQAAALVKKARDHLNLFHYDQAHALLKQAIQIDPENWEAYFLAGKSLLKQKKETQAEKYLKKAHDLKPDELDCQKALGAVYIFMAKQSQQNGKSDEMLENLHKACRADPGATKFWVTLLENWWQNGQLDKITAEGEFIVKETKRQLEQGDDKNLQQALVIVARSFYRQQDFPSADKFLKYASMIRQNNEELYSLKRELKAKSEEAAKKLIEEARKETDNGNFEKALKILEQAEKTSNASEVQDMVDKIQRESGIRKFLTDANALRQANKHEEALEKLEEASMQFPEDERIANLLAVESKEVEKIHNEQAEKNAKIIAEKKRRLEIARRLRLFVQEGKEHEDQKNYDIAIISYEKALKITPENEELKKKIANLKELSAKEKERQNAFAMAKADLESYFSNDDFNSAYDKGKEIEEQFSENKLQIAPIMAEICLKLEKFAEAREYAMQFETVKEEELLYNYIRGMAAYHNGENEIALEYLKKVDEKDSSFRPGMSSVIWKIYLYKFQLGIYIFLLILIFPLIRFAKEAMASFKMKSILRKIEKIRETGDYEANLSFLEERFAKEDCPNPKQVAVMFAEALLRTGNAQRAYDIVSNLLKRDAKNPHAKRIAGESCLILEDSSPIGMEHIQNLYKMDESRKDVVEYLARTYMRLQADHKLAQDFILKFISLNPGDAEAVVFLADIYMKRQSYSQQSQKIFERAIKIAPEVPDYYEALIQNHRKLDNHEEARKITEIARSKFPAEPAFMEGYEPSPGPGSGMRIGLKNPSSAYPDYDNIGAATAPASANPGGYPDYDSIGNDTDSAATNPGGFPDYDSIGEDDTPLPPRKEEQPEQPPQQPAFSGPAKVCPHCQAQNSVKEYYCASCGKPL